MVRYMIHRLVFAIVSVWGVVTLVFFLTKLIPGDAARVAAGRTATAEQVEQARVRLGLDLPVMDQYLRFLGRAVTGDFGPSASTHQPVMSDLAATVPITLQLVLLAIAITAVIGLGLGVFAAASQARAGDGVTRVLLTIGGGIPVFWLAVLMQWVFAVQMGVFPISGVNGYALTPPHVTGLTIVDALVFGTPAEFADSLGHFVLPAVVLSVPFIAVLGRNVRSNMIGALDSDYVVFAVAKGARRSRVLLHHALRSTMGSNFTLIGMQFGWMLGAALLVETTFALPGLGTYLNQAVLNQDTFAVLGGVLIIGVVVVTVNLLVDLLQILVDPRIRASHLKGALA